MKRCDVCKGYVGKPREVKVGDNVGFVIERRKNNSVKMSARTGKLMLIKADGFSVIYRGTVYHAGSVSHPEDPSPISLALTGKCSCGTENAQA
ncbi:hypothetical protein ACP3TC_07475 [Winslowiella sp. 2C04]|uniref:hypothetical protein n=1 Tax=Winslowiella sp. 2C04 TaxID=3416179 RepID=UPI003CF8CF89